MTHRKIFILFFVVGLANIFAANGQDSPVVKSKALFEKRKFTEVRKILDPIGKTSSDYADAQYYLGRVAVEEKKYDESIKRFEAAIEADGKKAEYHNWLGVMYGVEAMDANAIKQAYLAPKIRNEFEKATAIDPLNLQTQWGLINYYCKAPGFLGGSWDKALDCAKAISKQSTAQGYRAYGFVHAAQKKNDQAEKELLLATQTDPNDADNDYALAEFYSKQKKYDKALAVYEGVMKKNPQNMVSAFHLGKTTAECGRQVDRGIVCLTRYLDYNPKPNEPSTSGATLYLAMIYEKKGDKAKAKSYYQSSLKLEPGMKEAKEGLERVE